MLIESRKLAGSRDNAGHAAVWVRDALDIPLRKVIDYAFDQQMIKKRYSPDELRTAMCADIGGKELKETDRCPESFLRWPMCAWVRPATDVPGEIPARLGLVKVQRDEQRLYMRGISNEPFIHVTERGESGVIAVGYNVNPSVSMESLSQRFDAPVENIDEPGGGQHASCCMTRTACVWNWCKGASKCRNCRVAIRCVARTA